ncbi:MAG: zf-HC2 domain-containing protein [candidate division Zixibacteria bacterium]|nr:zf-HC2 domain-containing protein [candidate division Zixibacteria bacterium]
MTCGEVQPFIEDYADNSLDEHRKKKVKDHIESCPDCQSDFDITVQLKTLLRAFTTEEPECDYFEKATALIIAKISGYSSQSEEVH